VKAVADLLHDGSDRDLEIRIEPEPVPDRSEFRVEWQYIAYDYSEDAWKPIQMGETASERTGLRQRLEQLGAKVRDQVIPWGRGQTRVDERINVFRVNDVFLFSYYFAQDEIFEPIRCYYNEDAYRFEIPYEAFKDVQEFLQNYYYRLTEVDELDRFCVVQPRHTYHPEVLFNASVLQQTYGRYHVFQMQDQRAVHQAVSQGATPLSDTTLDITL
jgi:hypothetical protein